MEAIFQSFLLVAATEMGDKTQLLAFVLASRYKKPWTICAGILVATVLNHVLASLTGALLASLVSPSTLKWILAASFWAFAIWILIPDKDDESAGESRFGPFLTTVIAFFLAEMGDKTQLSTIALAARFHDVVLVTIGTTLGMMLADGLAVFFGDRLTRLIPMKWMRIIASTLFLLFGIALLLS